MSIWLYVCKTSSSFHFPYPLGFVCLLKETSVLRLANRSCCADGVFVCIVLLSLVYREKKTVQYYCTILSHSCDENHNCLQILEAGIL